MLFEQTLSNAAADAISSAIQSNARRPELPARKKLSRRRRPLK
jgi:hypothetical protein